MKNLRSRLKNCEGSFTIEASLVMPIVLFVTLILMFFSLYIYQQSVLHQAASVVAERSAYSWDNSHKDASNGSVAKGQYDSLYWRLTDDSLLSALFGWAGADKKQSTPLPGPAVDGEILPIVKMNKSGSMVPAGMQGEMIYQNTLLQRKVTAKLNQMISLHPLDDILEGRSELQTYGNSAVVEPVEFIRNVDLMRYYGSKFKRSGGNDGTDQGSAGEVLQNIQSSGK